MGDDGKKEDETKTEEKKEEAKTEEKKKEEEKEAKPASPVVLFVELHCVGCAKKIQRSILKIKGVERAEVNMAKSEVTITGDVNPQAVCDIIAKKTKRIAKVLSPLLGAEGEPASALVDTKVMGLNTVELTVKMHCEACALLLKKKMLKMKGVRTAETELISGKVTVTGTMDADHLVDYVYQQTRKYAEILPPPVADEKPKTENDKKVDKEEEKGSAADQESKPEEKKEEGEEKKDDGGEKVAAEQGGDDRKIEFNAEDQSIQKMMYYNYQPLYMIEIIPAPQIFSDENPNACCIL